MGRIETAALDKGTALGCRDSSFLYSGVVLEVRDGIDCPLDSSKLSWAGILTGYEVRVCHIESRADFDGTCCGRDSSKS
jgi:hypothetical protein